MSTAALDHVDSFTHPKATRTTMAFFKAIAELVPEGQTTTPLVPLDDLAERGRQVERTARRNRDFLVRVGQVKVHDGGRGIKDARYEMLQLTSGERPITPAPLPLLGRPKPPKRPKAKGQERTSDLLSDLEDQRSDILSDVSPKVGSFVRRWVQKVGHFVRCWFAAWKRSDILSDVAPPLGVDSRAGAIRKSKYVVEKYEVVGGARARDVEAFLDWFAAEYATVHQGARCTIDPAADGERVNELLHDGRTLERLKAMTLRLWHVTTDGVLGSNRWYIAERTPVRNVWLLHRKADFLDIEVSLAHAPDVGESDVWSRVLQRLEPNVTSDQWHSWLRQLALVHDGGEVIQVGGEQVHVAWVQKHHGELVRQALEAERPGARIDFVVDAAQKYG